MPKCYTCQAEMVETSGMPGIEGFGNLPTIDCPNGCEHTHEMDTIRHWHYQLMKINGKDENHTYYGLFEVYTDKDGNIETRTASPEIIGDSEEEISHVLEMMKNDIQRYGLIEENEDEDIQSDNVS